MRFSVPSNCACKAVKLSLAFKVWIIFWGNPVLISLKRCLAGLVPTGRYFYCMVSGVRFSGGSTWMEIGFFARASVTSTSVLFKIGGPFYRGSQIGYKVGAWRWCSPIPAWRPFGFSFVFRYHAVVAASAYKDENKETTTPTTINKFLMILII